ncbi:unnamed protein product [Amoebophrya sp. A25]|nr:unnamed protein product [Amoebophrya sp. A25]|eukprot:GSA25T00010244001.1
MKKNWADLIWGHDEEDGKENLKKKEAERFCGGEGGEPHSFANFAHRRLGKERIQEEIEENVQKLEQIKHRKEQDDHDSAITAEAVEVDGVASPKEFWKKHMKDKGSGRARFEYHCAHALAWYQIRSSHSDIVTRFATGRSIFSSEGGHNLDPVINVLGTHLLEGPKCLGMSVLFKGIMDAMFQRKVLRVRTEVNSDQNHVWTHVYFNIFFCDFSEVQDHLQREQSEHPQVAPAPQGELPGCSAIKWGSSFGCVLVQAWRSVGFDTGRLWSPSFFGSRQEFLAHSSGVVVQQGQPSALLQGSSSERTTSHGGRGVEPPRSSGSETHQKEEEKERQSHQKDKGEERQSHRQSEMMEKERQSHQKEKGEERQFIVDIAQLLLGNLENKVELSQCSSPLEHSTLTPHRAEVAEWYTKALSENCALSVVTDEPGKCCAEEFHQGEGGASGQEAARYIQDAENKCVRNCSIITSKEGEAGGPAPVDESSSCCDNYVTLRVEDNDYQGIPFVTHPEESLSVEWISKMISIGVLS